MYVVPEFQPLSPTAETRECVGGGYIPLSCLFSFDCLTQTHVLECEIRRGRETRAIFRRCFAAAICVPRMCTTAGLFLSWEMSGKALGYIFLCTKCPDIEPPRNYNRHEGKPCSEYLCL